MDGDSPSNEFCCIVHIEWIVFKQKLMHSIQTFQQNPFDGDSAYPFNDLCIRVCYIGRVVYRKGCILLKPTTIITLHTQ